MPTKPATATQMSRYRRVEIEGGLSFLSLRGSRRRGLEPRRKWLYASLILFMVGLACLILAPYTNHCEYTSQEYEYECAPYEITLSVLSLLETHNALISAIATACIAYFTLTLKRSTDKLWTSAEKQIEVAKQAAEAATSAAESARRGLSPLIGIHEIELCDPTDEEPKVHIRYSVTNYGSGVAIVNDIRATVMLQVWRSGEMVGISERVVNTWNSVLPVNEPSGFHVISMAMLTLKGLADIREGNASLRAYLEMTYRDTFKDRGDVKFSFSYDTRLGRFNLTPRHQQPENERA